MNTITLTNLQALTLEALTDRHLPATAFWNELLGPIPGNKRGSKMWHVERVKYTRHDFTVIQISRKMKSKSVEWMT